MSQGRLCVNNLGKAFIGYSSEWRRVLSWFGFPIHSLSEQWVLRQISFAIEPGEAVGIVGQNGAGKSTLLKLITGTLRPTEGTVQISGRVSAILELGMGFNVQLTGRQNVLHSAGLMGFTQSEVDAMMPEIEAFAEIGEYFDQAIQTYSTGMQMRVAFSVATAFRPEILIIDEALSVGDMYFQHKSFDRIRQFKEQGTSLLFVTHGMEDVRALCERVILLDKGRILKDAMPDEVVDYYNALIAEKENTKLGIEQRRKKNGWLVTEFGTKEAYLESLELKDANTGLPIQKVCVGQKLLIESQVIVQSKLKKLVLGHRITDRTGHIIWGANTWHTKQVLEDLASGQKVSFRLVFDCNLGPGSYSICFGLTNTDTHFDKCFHKTDNAIVFEVMNSDKTFFIGSSWLDANFEIELD